MLPLALMREGETAEIADVSSRLCTGGRNDGNEEYLAALGLRPGKLIGMVTNRGSGPLILRLDEARIALGRAMAMRIYVRRNEQ